MSIARQNTIFGTSAGTNEMVEPHGSNTRVVVKVIKYGFMVLKFSKGLRVIVQQLSSSEIAEQSIS